MRARPLRTKITLGVVQPINPCGAYRRAYCISNTCSRLVVRVYHARMVKKSEHRDLFPGALELMILKSLNWKPMHGYALAQRLKDISEDYLQIEEGSLYPALQRMLKMGWLETEMGLSARNRPVRIFKVTDAGRKHLEQELASVEKMFAGVTRVLALAGQ